MSDNITTSSIINDDNIVNKIKDPYFLIPFILKKLTTNKINYEIFNFENGNKCIDTTLFETSAPKSNISLYYFDIIGKTINSEINIKINNTNYDTKLDNVIEMIDTALIELDINNKPYILLSNKILNTLEIHNMDIDNSYKNIIFLNNISIMKENSEIILSQPTLLLFINCNIKNIKIKYVLDTCINKKIPDTIITETKKNIIKTNIKSFYTLFFKKLLLGFIIIIIIYQIYLMTSIKNKD